MKLLPKALVAAFGLAASLAQIGPAAASGAPFQVSIESACHNGAAVFSVANLGASLPGSMRFVVSRTVDDEVIRTQRNVLAANDAVNIVIPGVAETGVEVALSLDPAWATFRKDPVARIRCLS